MVILYSNFKVVHIPGERNKKGLDEEVQALILSVTCDFLFFFLVKRDPKLMWKYERSLKS